MLLKKAFSSPLPPSRGWMRDNQTGSLVERFVKAAKNPIVRKNVAVLMTGKLLGLAIITYLISWMLPTRALAAVAAEVVDPVNAINTVWVLVSASLVFCMQVGFVMLEAGFARSRESVNVLVEGIADTCICGITFWAWGFAFMFMDGTPFIGTHGFFAGLARHVWLNGRSPAGVLAVPVHLCRHLLHNHIWRDGGPHRFSGRPSV